MRHSLLSPTLLSPTVAMLIGLSAFAQQADPAPAPQVAYQGRLLEGSAAVTGTRVFTFAILNTAGTELWNSGDQSLAVDAGLYGVVLGSAGMPAIPPAVLAKSGLRLHVTIGGVALAPDVDILPAFQARSAWEVIGAFGGDIAGTQNQTLVANLHGIPLDLTTTPPTAGQALVFNGGKWVAGTVAGVQGPKGDTGAKGDTGPQGLPGIQGLQGVQGVTGPAGASPFTLNGVNAAFTGGSLGVGIDPPNASALLDLSSTLKGFLPPRMSTVQRGLIASPASGLAVYDTDLKDLMLYNGTAWVKPGSSSSSGVTSVSGTAPVAVANGTTTPVISLPAATSAQSGYLSAADWTAFNAKGTVTSVTASAPFSVATGTTTPAISLTGVIPAANGGAGALNGLLKANGAGTVSVAAAGTDYLSPSGSGASLTGLNATNLGSGTVPAARMPALTGDATMTAGTTATTVVRLQGVAIAATAPTSGQVLAYNGSQWAPAPASGTVDLTTGVTGTLPVANGGTGATTLASGAFLVGAGAGAVTTTTNGSALTNLNAGSLSSGIVPAAQMPALTGDVTTSAGSTATNVVRLQGRAVASTAPSTGYVLTFNGSQWEPAAAPGGSWNTGGDNTTSGTLNVTGTSSSLNSGPGWKYDIAASASGTDSSTSVSIKASGDIAAANFLAVSDARVKEVVARSEGAADLATLDRLRITDYRYKDTVRQGAAIHKKVIAQEVEAVYPNAVRRTVDFVPDIYRMSVTASYTQERSLVVGLDVPHGLQPGEKVRLIGERGIADLPVAEVLDATRFVVADYPRAEAKVFVFGRQVDDFRVVDYDALTTLNISATQELRRQVEALKGENRALRDELEQLKHEVKALLKR